MITATGFGVTANGVLDVRSVSPTRQGALVNWLVLEYRLGIYASDSPEVIEGYWRLASKNRGNVEVMHLTIITTEVANF